MKATIPALLLITLAACANGAEPQARLNPHDENELAKALDGKVAGKPVACVPTSNGANLRAIGTSTLVYRFSKKVTYRNDLIGACHGLRYGDALVVNLQGREYCRGDMARSVNLTTGTLTGSCALGEFVPYSTADAG